MTNKKREEDFVIKYEFVPSKDNALRLKRGYELLFKLLGILPAQNKSRG